MTSVLNEPHQSAIQIDEVGNQHAAWFGAWRMNPWPTRCLFRNVGIDTFLVKLKHVIKAQAATERAFCRLKVGIMEKFKDQVALFQN